MVDPFLNLSERRGRTPSADHWNYWRRSSHTTHPTSYTYNIHYSFYTPLSHLLRGPPSHTICWTYRLLDRQLLSVRSPPHINCHTHASTHFSDDESNKTKFLDTSLRPHSRHSLTYLHHVQRRRRLMCTCTTCPLRINVNQSS